MTDPDTQLDTLLGTALRDRMHQERPDLEHLAATSLRSGLRLRRRRRVVAVAGSTAAVAAVGVGIAAAQGGGSVTAHDAQVAASGTPSNPATTVTAAPGDRVSAPPELTLPVTLDAPGWTCEAYPVDEKMSCTKGARGISVVVRDAADHDAWVGDPDKGGSSLWVSPTHGNYFVSIQGDGRRLPAAELQSVVDGLAYADRWQRR